MSTKNCEACADLRENAPEFVRNGVTENVAESLKDNTGFNAKLTVLHDNCQDLNNANDCLMGNLPYSLPEYDVCDWKDFMEIALNNNYELLKAIIASNCGLWEKLEVVSYQSVLKLYTNTNVLGPSGAPVQIPLFNKYKRSGNMPSSVLVPTGNYNAVTVHNTLDVPILVNATFNCSIISDQPLSSCYIVVTRDGAHMGQTPFITPSTYDQQVQMEPFILQPGDSTILSYYFGIGGANPWFISQFGGTGAIQCNLVPKNASDPKIQESYFIVQATTIIGG